MSKAFDRMLGATIFVLISFGSGFSVGMLVWALMEIGQ